MIKHLVELGAEAVAKLSLRVWPKVDATGDCWEWTAALHQNGYGRMRVCGSSTEAGMWQAHRVVWELLVGPCPDGLEPDHRCLNHGCINPDHIEWVTHAENIRRCKSWAGEVQRRKTHCKHGHANWYVRTTSDGRQRRECRDCQATRYGRAA